MAGESRNRAERRRPETLNASELAERLGCSEWLVYSMVRAGTCPVTPIRLGRRLVWPKAAVDRLLAGDASSGQAPAEA